MLKILNTAASIMLTISPAMAQEQALIQQPETEESPPASAMVTQPTGGKIVMYRQGAIMGMGVGCPIRYKGKEIVELGRNKYTEWKVPAGSYILTNKTSSVDVNVFPGQTKYVRCIIKTGFMTGRADLQIVDEETFQQHSSEYERKDVSAPELFPAGN